ncbi:SRPBCC family protein [Mycobacteroides franklinii]|uniref:SRPBCC family protein n=2 Tax=Mycobacteroides franklinii TaxID=948102 RepID=A0A4V3A6T0_9MYCO|nr:SRPBCC family protein [Mycobacteroides franklinii]ORA62590.1 MxaD family protein [Mycobacteroides franklinii]TDH25957.1 SRPBCC family protein [Mycobacteroides franklinii]
MAMASFKLEPLVESDFSTSDFVYTFSAPLAKDAATVWAELNGESPLHWCKAIKKISWTSPEPRGVGSTRTAQLVVPGTTLYERFILWEESPERYRNAFTVETATFPGTKRFGEYYEVVGTATGSLFTWSFFIDPSLGFTQYLKPVIRRGLSGLMTDTQKHFA